MACTHTRTCLGKVIEEHCHDDLTCVMCVQGMSLCAVHLSETCVCSTSVSNMRVHVCQLVSKGTQGGREGEREREREREREGGGRESV